MSGLGWAERVLDATDALVVVLETDARIAFANLAFCRAVGHAREAVVGADYFAAFVDLRERGRLRTLLTRSTPGEPPGSVETQLVTRGGERRLVRWAETVLTDPSGTVSHVVRTGTDLTDRRAAETARIASEARYRALAEHSSDVIASLTRDGRLSHVSMSCVEMLGQAPDELVGARLHSLSAELEVDGPVLDQALAAAEAGTFHPVTLCLAHRPVGVRWCELILSPVFDGEGDVVEFVAIIRDVSERHRAEQALLVAKEGLERAVAAESRSRAAAEETLLRSEARYRALMDEAPDAILIADAGGRVLEANRRARDVFDLSEEVIAQADGVEPPIAGLFAEANRDKVAEVLRRLADARSLRVSDLAARSRAGRFLPVDTAWAMIDAGGARLVQCILQDVSAHKRAERALRRARDEAELADRAKSEFLANMSHELRTPLNAIIGFSDLIASEALGPLGVPTYREYIDDIRFSGQHLLSVINEVLDMAKVESGRIELHEGVHEPGDLVDRVMRVVRERAATASVGLSASIEPGLPRVRVDPVRFRQVLLNLLSNGVKFTPAGGTVRLAVRRGEDDAVSFTVTDTGIGMRKRDVTKALKPFGQVDGDLSRRHQGAGLGLPLARAFVELHGGSIVIDSRLGHGTTVVVRLPPERIVADAEAAVGPDAGAVP